MLRRRLFRGRRGRFVRRPRVHAFRARRRNPGPLLLVNPGKKKKRKVAKKVRKIAPKKKKVAKKKRYQTPNVQAQFVMEARKLASEMKRTAQSLKKKKKAGKAKKEKPMAKKRKAKKSKAKKTTKKRAKKRAAPKVKKHKKHKRRKVAAPAKPIRRRKGKKRRAVRNIMWTGPYPHMKHRRVPKKYRRRGRGWWNTKPRHRKASKKGWGRRWKGKRGRRFYRTSKGRKYHLPTGKKGKRGVFKMYNPDFGGLMTSIGPVLLGIAGFLGAALLVSKIAPMLPPSMQQWAPAAVPVAIALGAMYFAPKYLPKYKNIVMGLGVGLLMAGGISLMAKMLPDNIKSMIGLSTPVAAIPATTPAAGTTAGYVYRPGGGVGAYTLAPSMSGYVRRPGAGIGSGYNLSAPLENRYRRTLGANTMVPPGQFAPGGVPTQVTTGYETVGMKPYGLGLPQESRRYNNYSWIGVYDKGVYE
jgi:hypothetical protein